MSHQETVQERQVDHLRTRRLTMCAQVEHTLLDVEQMEDNHNKPRRHHGQRY